MIKIEELEKLAKKKEEKNFRFRCYLKNHADSDELDRQFKELHEKYFKIYKCSECRNCCKKIGTVIKDDELSTICNYLKIDKYKFVNDNMNEQYGEYTFKKKRCMFLDENNNCKLDKCLPTSCLEYPYTDQEERLFSLYSVVANASICPVVYEILEELKEKYDFR